jgi:acetyl-CoA carboxylase carboxyltransferase component
MHDDSELDKRIAKIQKGGAPKYHEKAKAEGKLFVRDRLTLLLDPDFEVIEDGLLAHASSGEFPADGVVTVLGRIAGRPVAVMANDSTVKAGSWGRRTVEKIIRIQETALRLRVPMLYLVDSAGARITDQIEMFPGRRGAGKIFFNQTKLSGHVPQVCLLFGPSAAGGAYIPSFCDVVVMVEGRASMYLGSPRMAEMVIGEKVGLEEMGGARMHCSVSGCGDVLVGGEEEAIAACKRYLAYFPLHCGEDAPVAERREPADRERGLEDLLPKNQNVPFDMREILNRLVDEQSWFELKELFAGELLTGLARIEGRPVGIVASQPRVKGGVLFVDSADKGARFIWLCDAFNIPLLFLADVPGFMIGTKVERDGIIRHGAKMIASVSEATVPKISVILRKAYGAGLYAMCGPGFEPDAALALPGAMIAVMGPEAAVNAVYANKIAELPEGERGRFVQEKRGEYQKDIDVLRLAAELIVDDVVPSHRLREEIARRLTLYASKTPPRRERKHAVHPV